MWHLSSTLALSVCRYQGPVVVYIATRPYMTQTGDSIQCRDGSEVCECLGWVWLYLKKCLVEIGMIRDNGRHLGTFQMAIFPQRFMRSSSCLFRLPYNLYCVGGDVKHCSLENDRVVYRLSLTVYKCLHGRVPEPDYHLSCARRSPKFQKVCIFVLPTSTYSLYHGFTWIRRAFTVVVWCETLKLAV